MTKEELKQLSILLINFNSEYGSEVSQQSGYTDMDKINCEEVMDFIDELAKKKD